MEVFVDSYKECLDVYTCKQKRLPIHCITQLNFFSRVALGCAWVKYGFKGPLIWN